MQLPENHSYWTSRVGQFGPSVWTELWIFLSKSLSCSPRWASSSPLQNISPLPCIITLLPHSLELWHPLGCQNWWNPQHPKYQLYLNAMYDVIHIVTVRRLKLFLRLLRWPTGNNFWRRKNLLLHIWIYAFLFSPPVVVYKTVCHRPNRVFHPVSAGWIDGCSKTITSGRGCDVVQIPLCKDSAVWHHQDSTL